MHKILILLLFSIIIFISSEKEYNELDKINGSACILDTKVIQNDTKLHGSIIYKILKNDTTKIYNYEILNIYGKGNDKDLIDGLLYCKEKKVNLINLSIALENKNEKVNNLIEGLINDGVLIVTSIPNSKRNINTISKIKGVYKVEQGTNNIPFIDGEFIKLKSPEVKKIRSNSYATALASKMIIEGKINTKYGE